MYVYHIVVDNNFRDKFENFLSNINIVNSKNVVRIIRKEDVVAIPKGEGE